jgi:hypothetical protein
LKELEPERGVRLQAFLKNKKKRRLCRSEAAPSADEESPANAESPVRAGCLAEFALSKANAPGTTKRGGCVDKNMKLDSVSRRQIRNKNYQLKKWLVAVFVFIFCLTIDGFAQFGLAQEAESPSVASSTPDALLPVGEPINLSDNASSTPINAFDNASSTPEIIGADPLANASSTAPTGDSPTLSASSTPAVCGNGLTEESEQCPSPDPAGSGPSAAEVGTGMDLNFSDNERPVVQAAWQMNQATSSGSQGKDDSLADGAQFMPSGQYQVDKQIEICAVASDPDGLADLASVSAQIYYPEDIYLGPNRTSSQPGCGQPKEEWFLMTALETSQGLDLFCQEIRNDNANLASFKIGYDFDALCGPAGDLAKETAKVFCGQNRLAYQDPAGEYRVKVAALDQKQEAGIMENSFKYLELVAFEIDFNSIDYCSMKLNTPKVLTGNETFLDNDGRPTLRNIGNTRLDIEIKQNDMGLGQSETGWNLTYQARVGQDASFTNYWPEVWATLAGSMNLGQTSQLDLAIEVLKFPEIMAGEHYAGKLSLNATAAPHLFCAQ